MNSSKEEISILLGDSIHNLAQSIVQKYVDKQWDKLFYWSSHRILKGRITQTSNELEIEVAKILADFFPNYCFLVDYPISIKEYSYKTKTIYPDILILRKFDDSQIINSKNYSKLEFEAMGLVELKIDLAHDDPENLDEIKKIENKIERDRTYKESYRMSNFAINTLNRIQLFASNLGRQYSYKHQFNKLGKLDKKTISLNISDDFFGLSVLLTSKNDHLGKYAIIEETIANKKMDNFFVLMGDHANNINIDKGFIIHNEQCENLAGYITERLI
jgi:hypothetical protein